MKKIKTFALTFIVLLAAGILLAACSDLANGEAEEGTYITISLGGSESRKAVPWNKAVDDANILHDIFIDDTRVGTGVKIGDGVKTYPASPGKHKVSVNGYYPAGTLFSYGEANVTVTAGQKAKCNITMKAPSTSTQELSGTITISPSTGAVINQDLTANYSGSETVTFQWKKDGENVGTASTTKPNKFKPTEGGIYTVIVSATGYKPKTSDPVTVNDPSLLTLTGNITITPNTGVITTGTLLTASYIGSESVALTFHWEKDGTSLGATGNTYTPTQAGSYSVIGRATGYNEKTSNTVTVIAVPDLSGSVSISPSPGSVVNIEMTATYSGSETITEWQWKKDGADIGINSSTFTPTATGNYTVTVSAAGHNSKTSAAVTVYGVGSGTAGDPFNVCNVATLQKVGTGTDGWGLDKHYKQVADIDLSSIANWTPIGTTTTAFTGSYDGNGHTISNLKITSATAAGVGLFCYIGSSAIVKNVGIVSCNINVAFTAVGGLAGRNDGTVEYCYSTGTVIGTSGVGGLVGTISVATGKVQNCYSACDVTGTTNSGAVGGVAGTNTGGTVQNCYATGTVSGGNLGGGVVGGSTSGLTGSKVKNCYATGTVSVGNIVGGVAGACNSGAVENCVALNPNISGGTDSQYVARVFGANSSSGGGSTTNSYGRSDMIINSNPFDSSYSGSRSGTDITSADWGSASWWQTQGFTTTDWDFSGVSATHLPKLNGMPGGLEAQNPVIIN